MLKSDQGQEYIEILVVDNAESHPTSRLGSNKGNIPLLYLLAFQKGSPWQPPIHQHLKLLIQRRTSQILLMLRTQTACRKRLQRQRPLQVFHQLHLPHPRLLEPLFPLPQLLPTYLLVQLTLKLALLEIHIRNMLKRQMEQCPAPPPPLAQFVIFIPLLLLQVVATMGMFGLSTFNHATIHKSCGYLALSR